VNLISVEQLRSGSLLSLCFGRPASSGLGMKPYDGSSLLEINPSLVFPILEMLLGGSGRRPPSSAVKSRRSNQSILEGLIRVILNDCAPLGWRSRRSSFPVESQGHRAATAADPDPGEAVVAISIEVRIGDTSGLMHLGFLPSSSKCSAKVRSSTARRKTQASEEEQARVLRLIRPAIIDLDPGAGPKLGFPAPSGIESGRRAELRLSGHRPLI